MEDMVKIIELPNGATYKLCIDRMDYVYENPFKEWDGLCPVLVNFNSGFSFKNDDYQETEIQKFMEDKLTYGMVKYHIKKFERLFNIEWEDNESMDDKYSYIHDCIFSCRDLETIAEVFNILHIKYRFFESRGYSQGDYAAVLCVLTDDFIKKYFDKQLYYPKKIFDEAEQLFNKWACGDVYEFELLKKVEFEKRYKDTDLVVNDYEWELVDSCDLFYGDNPETNGIYDYLPNEIVVGLSK